MTSKSEPSNLTVRAEAFRAVISENMRAYFANEISFPEFSYAQARAWDAVSAAGPEIEAFVLRAVRATLPGA